MDEDIQNR